MADANVLVGTLYVGEREFDRCKRSLERQDYPNIQHFVIENKPSKEAHRLLYSRFERSQDEFDVFVKLDADMVLSSDEAVTQIVDILEDTPDLDHVTLSVRDWYSQTDIMGLHAFSGRVEWPDTTDEELFTDAPPEIPGERRFIWDDPAPIASHSPDPSPLQAYAFGFHRGLKVAQPNRQAVNIGRARAHWQRLLQVWEHYQNSADEHLCLALAGALDAIQNEVEPTAYGADREKMENRVRALRDGSDSVTARVRRFWGSQLTRGFRGFIAVAKSQLQG